ncbi:MAG TPA: GWxTD domain-containing protein, partial [Bacteroidia bacterium]|nr:GWxTD domain-containing protein [Bacteroidia bacterium]
VVMSDAGIPGQSKLLAASTDMDVFLPGEYYLEVTFHDLNKKTASYELLYLDHRGKNSSNNFLLTLDSSETPLFRNYVAQNEKFRIHYYNPLASKLFVRYYKNRSGPAPPPYSMEKRNYNFTADSSWWMNYSPTESISLNKEGWYTFTSDSVSTEGITVARFHEGFPKISVAKQLLYPLRYLTMREEYIAMDTAVNTKKAVDAFWINNTGSQEHAREVIRNFYNRVEAANTLFATQIEGWKTDRGMIYLVFGPPENVYRTVDSETWIYGVSASSTGLTFVFDHRNNSFTDQEFVLERNTEFKVNWISAVDSWRQGHIYTLR